MPETRDRKADILSPAKEYDGMLPSDMKRLRQLEEENAKLEKLVADLSLDRLMLQDVLTKNSKACREAASGAASAETLPSKRTQKLYGIADQPGMAPEAANPRRVSLSPSKFREAMITRTE